MLNAVKQFSGAIGVAALGTVFCAQANHGGTTAFDDASELVTWIATVLSVVTFALVWLLPKHAQQAEG
jgi:Na+-driven multidrug efflux pump